MADESANYEGRLIAGHVLWVRDAENGGKWLPIVGLKGVPGQKGGVYIPQWDGRYLTFRYNPTSDGNPSPIALDLKGPQGERGPEGPQGKPGSRGPQGERGPAGEDGEGAFELAVQAGYEGTEREFYDALGEVVATGEKAQEAIELAKKNNHAHLFETREEFDLWIADPQMTNTLNIGDFLFIKETGELYTWDGDSVVPLPSPVERYPTVSELNAWLKAAGEVREGVCTCAKAAASSAEAAETAKTEAGKSATKAEESAKAAEEAVADKIDEAVADTRYLRVDSAKTNDLQQAIRFYNHTGEEPTNADGNSPFFVIGSQLKDDGSGNIKEDRWTSFWYYNGFMFRQMPESEGISFTFSRGGDDSIVRKAELDEATQDAITTDGGTVDGILRMKNPKVSADDDTRHDIALVPNANGQGLQVQFPGGSTAMIRMKNGVLATTAEVNAGLAAKQDKLIAGSGISIAEDGKTISATGGGGGGTSVTILAEWPETPDNTTVPGTKLVKDYVDGLVGDINAALEEV